MVNPSINSQLLNYVGPHAEREIRELFEEMLEEWRGDWYSDFQDRAETLRDYRERFERILEQK